MAPDGERRQNVRACYGPFPAWSERVTLEVSIFSRGLSYNIPGTRIGAKIEMQNYENEIQAVEGVAVEVDLLGAI